MTVNTAGAVQSAFLFRNSSVGSLQNIALIGRAGSIFSSSNTIDLLTLYGSIEDPFIILHPTTKNMGLVVGTVGGSPGNYTGIGFGHTGQPGSANAINEIRSERVGIAGRLMIKMNDTGETRQNRMHFDGYGNGNSVGQGSGHIYMYDPVTVTANILSVSNSNNGSNADLFVQNTSNTTNSNTRVYIAAGGTSGGHPYVLFQIGGSGEQVLMGLNNGSSDRFTIGDGATMGNNDRLRLAVATGVLDVDGSSGLSAATVGIYDDYDDAVVLRDWVHGSVGELVQEHWMTHKHLMARMGVIDLKNAKNDPSDPEGFFIKTQPMIRLLAGGIYQNRNRMDSQYEEMSKRLKELEEKLAKLEG